MTVETTGVSKASTLGRLNGLVDDVARGAARASVGLAGLWFVALVLLVAIYLGALPIAAIWAWMLWVPLLVPPSVVCGLLGTLAYPDRSLGRMRLVSPALVAVLFFVEGVRVLTTNEPFLYWLKTGWGMWIRLLASLFAHS